MSKTGRPSGVLLLELKLLDIFDSSDLHSSSGWTRWLPFIGYHHVMMMLISGSIVMTSKLNSSSRSKLQ